MGVHGLWTLEPCPFGDLFWGGKGLALSSSQTDLYLHFAAWRQFAFDELRHGHLVLWNPHYLCGTPFFGGFEEALLYPPNWLYLILPIEWAINTGIVLHVVLAGFFTYLWGLRRGLHPLASFLAGVVFMWGGAYFLHIFAGHLPNLCTMVWAPLIFMCIDGLVERFSARWVLVGIFAVSMQVLAGHPQYVYFTAILVWLYALLHCKSVNISKGVLAGTALIYIGSSLLAAVQLWTGIDAISDCGRNIPLEYRSAGSFSFPPENLLTLFLPDFFGNLTTVHYWGPWYLWEVSIFMGVVAFSLSLCGTFLGDPRPKIGLFISTLVAFVMAMGIYTPLYRFFYNHLPFFNGIRGMCKFDFLVSLFLALLAGIGLNQLLKSPKTPRWLLVFFLSLGILLSGLGLLIHQSTSKGLEGFWGHWFTTLHWLEKDVTSMDAPSRGKYALESGFQASRSLWIGGGIFLLIALLLRLKNWKPKAIYALAALSILELFFFARANRTTFEISLFRKKIDTLREIYSKFPGDYRVYGTGSTSLLTGGFEIWEDEPMVLGRYGRFVCESQGISENRLFSVSPVFQKFPAQLALLRLKYRVFIDKNPIRISPFPFKPLPRMLLLNDWAVEPDRQNILKALFSPKFEPGRKVYLETDPGFPPPGVETGTRSIGGTCLRRKLRLTPRFKRIASF